MIHLLQSYINLVFVEVRSLIKAINFYTADFTYLHVISFKDS